MISLINKINTSRRPLLMNCTGYRSLYRRPLLYWIPVAATTAANFTKVMMIYKAVGTRQKMSFLKKAVCLLHVGVFPLQLSRDTFELTSAMMPEHDTGKTEVSKQLLYGNNLQRRSRLKRNGRRSSPVGHWKGRYFYFSRDGAPALHTGTSSFMKWVAPKLDCDDQFRVQLLWKISREFAR